MIKIKVLNKIIFRDLLKYKKHTSFFLIGIIIISCAIFCVMMLLSSYQQYMINSVLSHDNWEVKLSNIKNYKISDLSSFNNIKEISKTSNIGIMNIPSTGITSTYLNLYAYDENSMKNLLSTSLKSGRLPNNSNEIAISVNGSNSDTISLAKNSYSIDDKLQFETENFSREYKIVGILNSSKYDEGTLSKVTYGAITYMDNSNTSEESLLDIYVSSTNINNIYDITNNISKTLNLEAENISYNNDLLNYNLVSNSDFKSSFLTIALILLSIIAISAFMLIYTTCNISFNERITEFGTLSSIGCNKAQIYKIIFLEAFILVLISISISFIISLGIVTIILNVVTILSSSMLMQDFSAIFVESNIPITMHFSMKYLLIAIGFLSITIFASLCIPAHKVCKTSPLVAINRQNDIKIHTKKEKFFLTKYLSAESNLAYTYIKRAKSNSNSVILSLITCILLFIITTNYINNIYAYIPNDSRNYNYLIYLDKLSSYDTVVSDLKKENLIDSYYTKNIITDLKLNIPMDKINKELLSYYNSSETPAGVFYKGVSENSPVLTCSLFTIVETNVYNQLLNQLGVTNLNDGECILLNKIEIPNYANFHITNYKPNENLSLLINSLTTNSNEDLNSQLGLPNTNNNYNAIKNIDLKINSVTDNFYGYFDYLNINDLYANPIAILVNQNTLNDIKKEISKQNSEFHNMKPINSEFDYSTLNLYVKSGNPYEIDNYLSKNSSSITGVNYEKEIESKNSKKMILGIFLYSLIGLVGFISILNIFNIIYSSIQLRKKNFAILKSLGMTKKQLYKMLRFECLYYCVKSLIIGIVLGIALFVVIYSIEYKLNNYFLYNMYISWYSILFGILFTFVTVYFSMFISQRTIKYDNLIDILKNESF